MKKVIFIRTDQQRFFEVNIEEIARDRANYYSEKDSDFESEYSFTVNDEYEAIDWLQNNMNFWSCETLKEVTIETDISEFDIESCEIVERND